MVPGNDRVPLLTKCGVHLHEGNETASAWLTVPSPLTPHKEVVEFIRSREICSRLGVVIFDAPRWCSRGHRYIQPGNTLRQAENGLIGAQVYGWAGTLRPVGADGFSHQRGASVNRGHRGSEARPVGAFLPGRVALGPLHEEGGVTMSGQL